MGTIYNRLFIAGVVGSVWLEPAIALAQDDSGSPGSGYVMPSALTLAALAVYKQYAKYKKQWDGLVDGGGLEIKPLPIREMEDQLAAANDLLDEQAAIAERVPGLVEEAATLRAELEMARQEIRSLADTAKIREELEEVKLGKAVAEALLNATRADLLSAHDRIEGLEAFATFDVRLLEEQKKKEKEDAETT